MSVGTSKIRWWWIIGSTAAFALGAAIALALFPEAGFEGGNPIGQFGWHLVGFALCLGLPLALLQCLLLALALQHHRLPRVLGLLLWIPATSGGIVAMIFPLWWLPLIAFVFTPLGVVLCMLPGMVALGVAQWLILRSLFDIKPLWIAYTVIGAAIGAAIGLPFALFIGIAMLPDEVTWASVTGAGMGVLQALVLVRSGEPQ